MAMLENNQISEQKFNLLREEILNIYENFCAHYLDRNINRTRFEKSYAKEIQQIFEKPSFNNILDTDTTEFPCIREVYRRLFKLNSNL